MLFEFAEMPDELVDAHSSGRLVVFVGSGASMSPPTCSPDFRTLATDVIAELQVDRQLRESDSPEFFLDKLAEEGLGVHAAVHRIISESTQPNSTHSAITQLALSSPPARVVTTNYDRCLSLSGLSDIPEFAALDLPGDEDFEGIVYLHGSISQDPQRLVVTRSDFARTYLGPLSPTLAFLHRLFTSKPVLFIGYSADDVLMRYVLQAARGRTELYSLRSGSGRLERDALGIMRIPYGDHCNLPALLRDWSWYAGATWQQHERRVHQILTAPGGAGAMEPHDGSYLARVVADPELVPQFTTRARGVQWRRWLAELPQLDMFDPAPAAGSTTRQLQRWLVKQSRDGEYSADEVARLFDRDGAALPDWVWSWMFDPGSFEEAQNSAAAGQFLVALADVAPPALRSHCARAIMALLSREPDLTDDTFLELIATWCALGASLVGFRDSRHNIVNCWSARPHLAGEMMSVVDACLRRANRLARIYAGTDPSSMRTALAGQQGGDKVHRGHLLVDAARDLMATLIETEPPIAVGYLHSWAASQWPILNRLAIYGWTLRRDETESSKLSWLQQQGWSGDPGVHHEERLLIASCVPHVGEREIKSLIGHIAHRTSPGNEGFTVDKLACIVEHAPRSPAARTALDDARNTHGDPRIADRADDTNPYLLEIDADRPGAKRQPRSEATPFWGSGVDLADEPARTGHDERLDLELVGKAVAIQCLEVSDPNSNEPLNWLPRFVASSAEPRRVAHIEAVTKQLLEAQPHKRTAQWHRWMRSYWEQRLKSRPRGLSDNEASAIADWATLLDGHDFEQAVLMVTARPTALRWNSKVPGLLLDALGPHSDAGIINNCPQQVVRLLTHMLKHSERGIAESFTFAIPAVAQALMQRTSPEEFDPLREQIARLVWKLKD